MTFPWSSDETALAVFQRLQAATMVQALSIHLTMSRLELVRFHDQYEVIACTSEVSEVSYPHIRATYGYSSSVISVCAWLIVRPERIDRNLATTARQQRDPLPYFAHFHG
jgi:hypothetical protein